MDVFEQALRESVDRAQQAMLAAQRDDRPFAADQHASRILDLLDRALENGIDTVGWVPASAWASVTSAVEETG
ncbi:MULTISPECIES: hypothetical protein [unclassified Pseudonocardia]|jgi:hypothetical protein|uniref:hypothetical protein n=1 Tax=unclassified Pseudonocardia TaxID=2619320 RepID=UPI00095A7E21|nr:MULTISPECIES: hypothetical protein [unclassified Pseudonocardia]MBN9101070.1 hypothetical protein [Pseudonocardia sp.]OJY41436.1 MAG: hypothetical protein BGP03_20295 [Pseudonocardia sp. 73-21]